MDELESCGVYLTKDINDRLTIDDFEQLWELANGGKSEIRVKELVEDLKKTEVIQKLYNNNKIRGF